MNQYQQYIALSRYARWIPELNRRETWKETVDRYMQNVVSDKVSKDTYKQLEDAIYNLNVMPSMRAMMTAGEALNRDNICGYNCSYIPVDHPRAFDECMYILMCGTGVGFSVERREVEKLPEVPEELFDTDTTIHVADSKIGWAKAYKELIVLIESLVTA